MSLRDGDREMPEYAAPVLAHDLSDLPPAYVEVDEFDYLCDEEIAYAQALQSAGTDVQSEDVPGTFHGFDFFNGKEISKTMVRKRAQALWRVLICATPDLVSENRCVATFFRKSDFGVTSQKSTSFDKEACRFSFALSLCQSTCSSPHQRLPCDFF